jgi:hypothetical protein
VGEHCRWRPQLLGVPTARPRIGIRRPPGRERADNPPGSRPGMCLAEYEVAADKIQVAIYSKILEISLPSPNVATQDAIRSLCRAKTVFRV